MRGSFDRKSIARTSSGMSHRGPASGNISVTEMRERESLLNNTDDAESHKDKVDGTIPIVNSFHIIGGTGNTVEKGNSSSSQNTVITQTGLMVLLLLAVQNCSKNLLMRYVMKDQPKFLTSAAVLGSEFLKLSASVAVITLYDKKSFASIIQFLHEDFRNTILLTVPASAYNLQMSLEYVALANLDAAMFSVLVQTKLLFTASFSYVVLRKRLRYIQVISLVLLTCGVMLCNLNNKRAADDDSKGDTTKGIFATLGIAISSGFASVYTEKVIKGGGTPIPPATVSSSTSSTGTALVPITNEPSTPPKSATKYGLAYTQVQLALMSLVTIGIYAIIQDWAAILSYGLFHNFTPAAFLSIVSSAVGGLIVAAVLKYADSVLKGYATSMSVILTGVLSMILFGTKLTAVYYLGIINVVVAVLLYNGKEFDKLLC